MVVLQFDMRDTAIVGLNNIAIVRGLSRMPAGPYRGTNEERIAQQNGDKLPSLAT
jgi:hypothetical protein